MASHDQLDNLHGAVPGAQAAAVRYGVPASVTLAQWIFESSWGMSKLAITANNDFGIKCSHLAAPNTYVEMPTAEFENGKRVLVEAQFAKYPNVAASFDAHARLLTFAPRYHPAMLAAHDPFAFAGELQKCGYSTNPQYAQELQEAMRLYNLTQYDRTPPAQAVALEAA